MAAPSYSRHARRDMEIKSSKGKEIKIPGPDHPITISPVEGKVRVTVAGRIVAESARTLRLEEKGYPPSTTCRAAMRTYRCSFGLRMTPIVRTRAIAVLQHSHRRNEIGTCHLDVRKAV